MYFSNLGVTGLIQNATDGFCLRKYECWSSYHLLNATVVDSMCCCLSHRNSHHSFFSTGLTWSSLWEQRERASPHEWAGVEESCCEAQLLYSIGELWSAQGVAPCRFSSAPCRFISALSFSESPLVSSGFYQRYFELEVAESAQLRRKVARFF